ncbi:sialic acid-binding Ig-like lectin 7 [Xiphophorus hellerii]|uniref:sialic acid-binding Ig-like lectin 7 n=1 Tax=Xiphophorus hellerii TaxID=8084 RepID=UPI0013B46D0B|nr:sialic acid-binding Ig-like lectin 7 [Xiphophorus hellerii]XP_032408311.1 sialic acid-binding Ig-like lectin 7 [Xiphophorus hellerii]
MKIVVLLMEGRRNVMAALSEGMLTVLTVNLLLSVSFLSGRPTGCEEDKGLIFTAPREIEGLSGACLQIPCSFTVKPQHKFDPQKKTFGVWLKPGAPILNSPKNVVYNSSQLKNKYDMNITGNLREKNCTTVFYNINSEQADKYFFRIENGPFKISALCKAVNVNVRDSAWRPRIEISGDMKEKNSVIITCSALTPCPQSPPKLTWNLKPDHSRLTEKNTDGTFTAKIQKNITLSDTHDGFNITCFVRYPVDGEKYKFAKAEVTLSVSYAPKNTSASISLSEDGWVNMTCSSRAKPPISLFTWFRNSTNGTMQVTEGDVYGLNITEEGIYHCVATNDLGNQTSPKVHLTGQRKGNLQVDGLSERRGILSTPVKTSLVSALGVILLGSLIKIFMWFLKIRHLSPKKPQTGLLSRKGSQKN